MLPKISKLILMREQMMATFNHKGLNEIRAKLAKEAKFRLMEGS